MRITSFGPLWWILVGVLFVAGMGAVFVILDCIRRTWLRGSRPAQPFRWWYLVPQAIWFVLMMIGQIHSLPIGVTGVVVLCTPLALGQQVAYLLRVVFPLPVEVPADFEQMADGGDTDEPGDELPHTS